MQVQVMMQMIDNAGNPVVAVNVSERHPDPSTSPRENFTSSAMRLRELADGAREQLDAQIELLNGAAL